MPQIPYTVKFPDGQSVSFSAPSDMTDSDVYQRALQERGIRSGKIPTTFIAGAAPEGAQALTQAGMSGAGYLTGNPALVASAPLAARGARALAERATGQDVTPTSASELLQLGGEGAIAGYGPQIVSGIARPLAQEVGKLRVHTLPQAIAKAGVPTAAKVAESAEAISPTATGRTVRDVIGRMMGSGAPQAQTPTPVPTVAGSAPKAAFNAMDVLRIRQLMAQGVSQEEAVKKVLELRALNPVEQLMQSPSFAKLPKR